MAEVLLHVYDVTNSLNVKANTAIVQLNKLMRDGIGVGGIFHGAIQLVSDGGDEEIFFDGHSLKILNSSKSRVYEEEWSFGYCENGSGVFSCPPKENPMYTYRETVPLGRTTLSPLVVNQILTEMSREWQGCTYDLLARNCNHFCEVFCARLGVQKLPLWVNRFAKTGDAAVEVAGNTMERLKQAKDDVVSASKVAYRFIFGDRPTSSAVSPDPGLSNARLGGSNSSRRFTFSRTPSRILGRTSVDSPVEESVLKENASKVENDRSRPCFSLWKESPFVRVEETKLEPSLQKEEPKMQSSLLRVEEPKLAPPLCRVEEPDMQPSVLRVEVPELEPPLHRVEEVNMQPSVLRVEEPNRVEGPNMQLFGVRVDEPKLEPSSCRFEEPKLGPFLLRVEDPKMGSSLVGVEEPKT